MQIVEPSFEILFPEDIEGVTKKIEIIARECYQSEGDIKEGSDLALLEKLLNRKHYPMFDHRVISVRVICDRGVSHEIVRHRIAAYAQESTRYCNYSKEKFDGNVKFIKPCFFPKVVVGEYSSDTVPDVKGIGERETIWIQAMLNSEHRYLCSLAEGCSAQEARSVLPNSLKTAIVMTLSLTAWRHFFELRTAKTAHPQMREIARPMLDEFKRLIPLIFNDINY